jgi:molecular chaperone DnaK
MAADNRTLGRFYLKGIPPAPHGVPQIEVNFDIDANGILGISAKDLGTGKEQSIRVEASAGLPTEDVERMRRELEAPTEKDSARRQLAELRNQTEEICAAAEKLLRDRPELWDNVDPQPLKTAITKARNSARGDDAAAIRAAADEVVKVSQSLLLEAEMGK